MPNPIIGRIVTSKRTPNREPITPVPEKYSGDSNPYRGVDVHGVDNAENWRDPADDLPIDPDGRLVDVYEKEPPEPDPIPVYLVNQSSRERRAFKSGVAYAAGRSSGSAGKVILGQDDSRTRATIRNPEWSATTIYIAHQPELANAVHGFPIPSGQSYQTDSQARIYATVDANDDVQVQLAIEYRVSLDG